MSKGYNVIIELSNTLYRFPVNRAVISLYDYPATITDGTVFGTPAISTDGTAIVGQLLSDNIGRYKLNNIPTGKYTAIATGVGINAQVLVGYEDLDIGWGSDVTGSDIPYKDNTNVNIADKIDNLDSDIYTINETKATASDITVNGKGSYTTIQSAIDDSTSGDFIHVRKGEYSEHIVVKDGISIHMEDGVIVTSPSDTEALYGTDLKTFKLSGGGRFVNNGIQKAIYLSGDYREFKGLNPYTSIVELNSGKVLIYSALEDNYYCLTEDGITFESATGYTVPLFLKTIGKDESNRVFGFVTQGDVGFYYSEDNGQNWIQNNDSLEFAGNELGKGLHHVATNKRFLGCNETIYRNEDYTNAWVESNTGLPTGILQYIVSIGDYVYACIGDSIYKCDATQEVPDWTIFNTGVEGATLTFLESNGTDRLYTWDSVAKKLYQCKVSETSTWTEITLPANATTNSAVLNDLIYFNNYLYFNLTKFGIIRTWCPSGTTGLYTRYSNWESFNKGILTNSFNSVIRIYKVTNYFYHYYSSNTPLRYNNGDSWIPIKGGAFLDIEFDSAENLGYLNNPVSSYFAVSFSNANLKLRCREIYGKRNGALRLIDLYGTLDAKVGRLETGVPGMPNGESGSTALYCFCDGYFEADEIIVNNVGHCLSPRGGIMHFRVNRMIVTNNHPSYQVQAISQITFQAQVGTTTTIEFDEIFQNRGKYANSVAVQHDIGYLILKGKNIISTCDAVIQSGGNLELQVDNVEAKGYWVSFASSPQFPYAHYCKNTSFRSQIYLNTVLYKDNVLGGTGSSVIFENCTFYSKGSDLAYQLILVNYPYVNLTPQSGTVNIKGINTFNLNPHSLITFLGEGIVSVNGNIMNYGKYVYLVGGESIAGSWRMKAILSGNIIFEYTIDGTNWVTETTITNT